MQTSYSASSERVTYAMFRQASEKEMLAEQGGWIYQALTLPVSLPWKIFQYTLGTAILSYNIYKGNDARKWTQPFPQDLSNKFWSWFGYPEQNFIKTFKNFIFTNYRIDDEEEVCKAFFQYHRNDGVFKNSYHMKSLFNILKDMYPKEKFSFDDMILTCDSSHTRIYQNLLTKPLAQSRINEFTPTIQNIALITLKSLNSEYSTVEITSAVRFYTSHIFTVLILGNETVAKELCKSVKYIHSQTILSLISKIPIINRLFADETLHYQTCLNTYGELIDKILLQETPLFENSNLTPKQKRATLFSLLFAGQETTSSLLSYIILQLAFNSTLQNELYNDPINQIEAVNKLFTKSIREFTPAWTIYRTMGDNNVCLEYKVNGEETLRKKIFLKDEVVSVNIAKMAEKLKNSSDCSYLEGFVFGSGRHPCPGDKLAHAMITQFIATLVKNYIATTDMEQTGSEANIALRSNTPIYIKFSRREADVDI